MRNDNIKPQPTNNANLSIKNQQPAHNQQLNKAQLEYRLKLLSTPFTETYHHDEPYSEIQFDQSFPTLDNKNYHLLKNSVGVIVSVWHSKQRLSKKNKKITHKQIKTHGTGFLIGRNLVLTAAHNIYNREYFEYASEVYFLPQINNNQSAAANMTKAQKFRVFDHYTDELNVNYSKKFDIGVIVLEPNTNTNNIQFIEIEWMHKIWQLKQTDSKIMGYPSIEQNNFQNHYVYDEVNLKLNFQDQFLTYTGTSRGFSGGPLVMLDQHNKLKFIGVHKGKPADNSPISFGLHLGAMQNTQEMVYQLIQDLQAQKLYDFYEPSCKRMRQSIKGMKLEQISNNLQNAQKLKKQNETLKQTINERNKIIQHLNYEIQQLRTIITKYENQIERKNQTINQTVQKNQKKVKQMNLQEKRTAQSLNLSQENLQNLNDFIQYRYVDLKQLNLNNNKLTKLPAINAPQLQKLWCFRNQITEIEDFAKFEYSHLKILNLSCNKLKSIPRLKTVKLLILDLSSNNQLQDLTRFAEEEYPNLKELTLFDCKIKRLPVLKTKQLKTIGIKKDCVDLQQQKYWSKEVQIIS